MSEDTRTLFEQATDPAQYDKEAIFWSKERAAHSPSPDFFRTYLAGNPAAFAGKDVVDIGSGTGWLLDYMHKAGAKSVSGIDPARSNVLAAQQKYPHVRTLHVSLEEFSVGQQFDLVIAVMMFQHVAIVAEGLFKVSALLRPTGEFWLVVPDFTYARMPRFGYDITVEERAADEYVVQVVRPSGTITDVIRQPSVYKEAAQKVGLTCYEEVPMKPTPALLATEPHYEPFKEVAIAVLLRFRKVA